MMGNTYKFLIFLALMCSNAFAQQRILIDGRAKVYKSGQQVIHVKNLTTNQQLKSDLTGYFSIEVGEGDVLSFWSDDLKGETITITPEIALAKQLELTLLKKGQSLEEIVIESKGSHVDPLGLKMKKYSQAERQYLAESYYPFSLTSFSLTPIINMFNGRRKQQRKALDYARDDVNFQYFKKFYPDEYLIKRFNMPKEYIDALVYFVIEQPGYDIMEWSNQEAKDLELAALVAKFKEAHKLN
ncbi:hypothetical protein [Flavobacterium sp. JP2137]|uniref:hypothetical protein n=1 Tax=Flavobacterium sp. JP2137 TaxID=3414510 RepID=UPI003D2FD5E9